MTIPMEMLRALSAIRSYVVDTVQRMLRSDLEIEYGKGGYHSTLHTAVQILVDPIDIETNRHLNTSNWSAQNNLNLHGLLQSGRLNVNALTDSSKTPLHLAVACWTCIPVDSDGHKDLVADVVELLLKNNANINAKSSKGQTPLMMASERGYSRVVQLLLEWRDEFGAGVELNARDIHGETALIKAAKWDRVEAVELLLKHGCLDKFQDHRGFYALHASIYGHSLQEDISSDFLGSVWSDSDKDEVVLLNRYGENRLRIAHRKYLGRNNNIRRIVRLLVTNGFSDVNSTDFRGNTVLDLALKSKLPIGQETIEQLKSYGAGVGVSMNIYSENYGYTYEITDKLGKTELHRLSTILTETSVTNRIEAFNLMNFFDCGDSGLYKERFEAMTITKDHRGRTALHYAVMIKMKTFSGGTFLLINSLKPIINERDSYGRTPLHYCQSEHVYESLVEQGADEHIRDVDGKSPKDLWQLKRKEDDRKDLTSEATRVLEFLNNDAHKQWTDDISNSGDQLIPRKLDPWMIWKDSEYAYRDQFSTMLLDEVRRFMNRLSDEIGKRDPRFECRPVLIGSAEEGTKTGLPDEFDFNFILTKLSDLCDVVPSPEAPCGFVHLKRRPCCAENRKVSQDFKSQENLDWFFNNGDYLLTTEIASRFRILYLQIMSEPEFWKGENLFEWDTCNEMGFVYSNEERQYAQYDGSNMSDDLWPSTHLCSTIQLRLNRPIEGRYMFKLISLDIVPCIKINGWWPEEALSGVNDEIKSEGCHLVFDQPQRNYPWVPFSDPFARISFAPAESRIIKECSAVAKAAYMVGKQLLSYHDSKLTYVLKTCLMYCTEALKDHGRSSLTYEYIDPAELRIYIEKLMFCFLEFYLKDFLPCYMMPSFHLPIEGYPKSKHDQSVDDINFQYSFFPCTLYRSLFTAKSSVCRCPPTAEPLNEEFNRNELLRKLSINRSFIEHSLEIE